MFSKSTDSKTAPKQIHKQQQNLKIKHIWSQLTALSLFTKLLSDKVLNQFLWRIYTTYHVSVGTESFSPNAESEITLLWECVASIAVDLRTKIPEYSRRRSLSALRA